MTTSHREPTAGRYLPLAGAIFTGLMVLGAVAFPMPPGGDVTAASKPQWLAAHYNAVIAQSYVRALAAVALIALAAAVAAACRRVLPAGTTLPALALAGGAISGSLLLLAQATGLGAAVFVHAGGAADTTRGLGALQNAFLDMSAMPTVLLFTAAGITALRTGLLPRWLAIASLAGVPVALADAAGYDGSPLASLGLLGLLYLLAWSLITGVRLHLADRGDADTANQPTTAYAA